MSISTVPSKYLYYLLRCVLDSFQPLQYEALIFRNHCLFPLQSLNLILHPASPDEEGSKVISPRGEGKGKGLVSWLFSHLLKTFCSDWSLVKGVNWQTDHGWHQTDLRSTAPATLLCQPHQRCAVPANWHKRDTLTPTVQMTLSQSGTTLTEWHLLCEILTSVHWVEGGVQNETIWRCPSLLLKKQKRPEHYITPYATF